MDEALGLALAAIGVAGGLLWRVPAIGELDRRLAVALHTYPSQSAVDQALERMRILGTKWALMAFLGLVALMDWRRGIAISGAALLGAAVERGLKLVIQRERPYLKESQIALRQRQAPSDPSFPSGDASRAWFVAASCAAGAQAQAGLVLLALIAACLVSWGRVRLGSHYPADVWAGGWLGFGLGFAWGGLFH